MNKNLTRETIFTKLVPSQTSFWDLQNLIIRTGVLGDIAFWLYVLVMSRTRFGVNPHSIVAWMSRNSFLEAGAKSEG